MNTNQVQELREQVSGIIDHLGEEISSDSKAKLLEAIPKILLGGQSPCKVLGFPPEKLEDLYLVGYNFFYAGKYKDALKIFNVLRELDPDDERYSFAIAACYQLSKDYVNAASNYINCSQLDPTNPLPYFHLYDCFKKSNLLYSAFHSLIEARVFAEENPDYAELKEKITLELSAFTPIFEAYLKEEYRQSPEEGILE